MKEFIITEEILLQVASCIAGATHPNAPFSLVNTLLQKLQQLPENKEQKADD